jgi:hypothetical protein
LNTPMNDEGVKNNNSMILLVQRNPRWVMNQFA